jgi:hypothetical protein
VFKSSVEVLPHGPMIGLQFYKYRLWMALRYFFFGFLFELEIADLNIQNAQPNVATFEI